MLAAIIIALACEPPALVEECEVIEVNTVLDCDGDEVLRQLIFWDYEQPLGEYCVADWKYARSDLRISKTPKGYAATFMDGDKLRRVEAAYFKETWTVGDPELRQREVRKESDRRHLLK